MLLRMERFLPRGDAQGDVTAEVLGYPKTVEGKPTRVVNIRGGHGLFSDVPDGAPTPANSHLRCSRQAINDPHSHPS